MSKGERDSFIQEIARRVRAGAKLEDALRSLEKPTAAADPLSGGRSRDPEKALAHLQWQYLQLEQRLKDNEEELTSLRAELTEKTEELALARTQAEQVEFSAVAEIREELTRERQSAVIARSRAEASEAAGSDEEGPPTGDAPTGDVLSDDAARMADIGRREAEEELARARQGYVLANRLLDMRTTEAEQFRKQLEQERVRGQELVRLFRLLEQTNPELFIDIDKADPSDV